MSDTPAEQLRRRWYMSSTAETRQSAAMFAANELDRLQSLADELAAALTGPEENPQLWRIEWLDALLLAIDEGAFGPIGGDEDPDATITMLGHLQDLVINARAALAKYEEVKS